jgi:hypothetical protein
MKASILELRYKMKDVLCALDRKEEVSMLYRGKVKGTITPADSTAETTARKHPFFGSLSGEQIRQQTAECHARKIQQANEMPDRELFFAVAELFDYACRISLAGLRNDYPELSESEIQMKLRGYLTLVS